MRHLDGGVILQPIHSLLEALDETPSGYHEVVVSEGDDGSEQLERGAFDQAYENARLCNRVPPCLDVLDEVPQLEDLGDQTGEAEHGRAAEPRHEQGQGAGKKGAKRIPGEFAREFAELLLDLGVCHFVLMRHCGCLWFCAAHECFTWKCDKVRCYRQSLKFKGDQREM